MTQTLIDSETYLKSGAHIGTRFKSGDMKKYVFKVRKDGLNVLDVGTLDERIKIAADFLARHQPEKILVVARKLYAQTPVKLFAEMINAKAIGGRFVPGTLTNPKAVDFVEAEIIFTAEPEPDAQAIEEARRANIPVISLVSTNNSLKNIDLAIPTNNKGRKSLALVYWLLTKEFLKAKKEIKEDSEFKKTVEDFEYKMQEGEKEEAFERPQKPDFKRPFKRFNRKK